MNPCPCGFFGHPQRRCSCTPTVIRAYIAKISGPILDRIDLHVLVEPVDHTQLNAHHTNEKSAIIRERVEIARSMQLSRQGVPNAQMNGEQVKLYCKLEDFDRKVLMQAMEKQQLSARSHDRILKVARTIADLAGSEKITLSHLSEAISYRCSDFLKV